MKKVLLRIRSFIKWLIAWCVGHIFYKGKYLHGKYFARFSYSIGWQWTMHDVFMQKIIGINRHVPFPVNYNVTVTNWRNIEFDRDNITIFQKPGNYYQASGAKIIVGKDSFIACNVGIVTANHDLSDLAKHQPGKDVVIGSKSWIGLNSVILPGVVLGPHTIVGAGSVVTKSFTEGNCVIAGNPAKKIKDLELGNTLAIGNKDCTGCMLCVEKCPCGAITIETHNGFARPVVDKSKCIKCGLCNRICPVTEKKKTDEPTAVYALCDNDEEQLRISSSGGAFGLLARKVIDMGGVVSGVTYDKDMRPHHMIAHTKDELYAFHGSKYVQSTMGDIYKQLDCELKTGKPVLASGTACQIAAIRKYFGDKYDNLYLVDMICHGVQSPVLFEEYIKKIETENKKKVVDFRFRDKTNGWKKSNVKIIFDDASELIMTRAECEYFNYFNYLRRSCYSCHFRGFNNYSDITIGDYWGIETLTNEFPDDAGVSIALIHTPKGQEMIEGIRDKAHIFESNIEHAVKTHKKLKSSISPPPPRDGLFDALEKGGYKDARRYYYNKTRLYRMKTKIKHMIGGK